MSKKILEWDEKPYTNKQYTIQIELSLFDNVKIAIVANKEVDIPRGRQHDMISKSISFLLLL